MISHNITGICPIKSVRLRIEIEDMAKPRNEHREWVQAEIKRAISSLNPHGWKKAIFILRELGPLATIIGILIALLAITLGAIYQSFAHIKEETEFRTHTEDRLKSLESIVVSFRI